MLYDEDFNNEDDQDQLLKQIKKRIKSIYNCEELNNIIQNQDFTPLIKNNPLKIYIENEKIPLKKSDSSPGLYEEELRNLAYELEEINPTYMTNACYIGKRLFGLGIPGDFKPYGKLSVSNTYLGWEIHSMEKRMMSESEEEVPSEQEEHWSALRRLGVILKSHSKDDIRLVAVYLLRGNVKDNFIEEEKKRAEHLIERIKEDGNRFFN